MAVRVMFIGSARVDLESLLSEIGYISTIRMLGVPEDEIPSLPGGLSRVLGEFDPDIVWLNQSTLPKLAETFALVKSHTCFRHGDLCRIEVWVLTSLHLDMLGRRAVEPDVLLPPRLATPEVVRELVKRALEILREDKRVPVS